MVLPVFKPWNKSMFEDWVTARGGEIVASEGQRVYLKLNIPCPHLSKATDGYECDVYNDRPEGCRKFDGRSVDFLKCAWKDVPKNYILEKAGATCPQCGRHNAVQVGSRFKREAFWVRRYRCANGHIFEEIN